MTPWLWIMTVPLVISLFWLGMVRRNLARFRPAPDTVAPASTVSVCIPARNEEANIGACVGSLLAQDHTDLEVLVYDDGSTDRTGEIIRELAAADGRVRIVPSVPLPEGWSGKQHACDRMGREARGDWVLFTDADVRFEPDCIRRTLAQAEQSGVALISTFPRQVVGSVGEALHVPMMFVLLMGYLPMGMMRAKKGPGPNAGCGQFLFVQRGVYLDSGGHGAFRASFHDGIKLPASVRATGEGTDLFDGTGLCSVRMYTGFGSAWQGFAKNAYEGLGSPVLLVFLTLMHLGGHAAPWILAPIMFAISQPVAGALGIGAIAAQMIGRAALCARFRHAPWLAAAHPVTMVLMTLVQWHSFWLELTGSRSWRGRPVGSGAMADA